jgi:predicted transglutaminase-like protease
MQDMLGHPLRVGDLVLTTRYQQATISVLTKILKVNPKTVVVELNVPHWDDSTKQYSMKKTAVKRQAHNVIVVSAQVAHNRANFPENML